MHDHDEKAVVGACVLTAVLMVFAGPWLFARTFDAVLAVAGCGSATCPPAVALMGTFAGAVAVCGASVGLGRFLYRTARRDA